MTAAPAITDKRRRADLGAIHAGKRALALDDDTYRELLKRVAGVTSAANLDAKGRARVLTEMRRLGFGRRGKRPASFDADQARLAAHKAAGAKPQEALILTLWEELEEAGALSAGGHANIAAFIYRQCGAQVSHPRFLTAAQANKVIEGLKAWAARVR